MVLIKLKWGRGGVKISCKVPGKKKGSHYIIFVLLLYKTFAAPKKNLLFFPLNPDKGILYPKDKDDELMTKF